jgi:histidyl-tRNA synthetase
MEIIIDMTEHSHQSEPMSGSKITTEPYRGVRDFYPQDMAIEKHIFETMRTACERFGYEEYSASLLEPSALYRAKSSEEIVNEQTYSFVDRGGRDVTLRPEMTPTVARMVAARRRELVFPLRWFSIPNVFRYENPQRGRLREHWQLNVDLFGAAGIEADMEIITLAYSLLKAFGAKDTDFEIRINDRATKLAGIAEKDLTADQKHSLFRLMDKKEKMPAAKFKEKQREILKQNLDLQFEESADTKKIIDTLKKRGISNIRFSDSLVRGFDYYTGMVFEVYDTDPKNPRSLFGGGRYDNLLELFGAEKTPAVGFGAGDVTIRDFLETHALLPKNLWPTPTSKTQVMLCIVDESAMTPAEKMATELRQKGINTALDISKKKIGDQIKNADKRHIPYIIAIGETEIQNSKYSLKNLASGAETAFSSIEEIIKVIK